MGTAMGILAILITFFLFDLLFLTFTKVLDYFEKQKKKKMYKLGILRFFMVAYKSEIITVLDKDEMEKNEIMPKDSINSNTISVLAFWLQIMNLVFFVLVIGTGVARILDTEKILLFRIIFFAFIASIPVPGIIYGIKNKKDRI